MDSFAAGIVPYIQIENTIYLLLGLERSNNLWSGFIGGSRDSETIEQTAFREFSEETAMIFEEYHSFIENELTRIKPHIDISSTGKNVYIYFIKLPVESQEKIKFFIDSKEDLPDKCYHEKSIIKMFTLNEIKRTKRIYDKMKQLILLTSLNNSF